LTIIVDKSPPSVTSKPFTQVQLNSRFRGKADAQIPGTRRNEGLLSDEIRKGFSNVAVNMRVKSDASVEEFTEMALYSPVYDIVSKSLPAEFTLTTY